MKIKFMIPSSLVQVGGSLMARIPPDVLKQLGWVAGDPLLVSAKNKDDNGEYIRIYINKE